MTPSAADAAATTDTDQQQRQRRLDGAVFVSGFLSTPFERDEPTVAGNLRIGPKPLVPNEVASGIPGAIHMLGR